MSFANPAYAKYVPEVLPEVQVDNVAVAGAEIARYESVGKHLLEIRNFVSTRPAANPIETVIYSDISGEGQKLYSAAQGNVRFEDLPAIGNKIRSKSYVSVRQRSIGGAEANIVNRWHTVVRGYNLLDLHRWGEKQEDAMYQIAPNMAADERTRIIAAGNIPERELAGDLPRHSDLLSHDIESQFDDIKEIDRQIPALAAAGGSHVLTGAWIQVPPGMVAVILGVSVDAAQVIANLSVGGLNPYNACFLFISRDDLTNYVRMDAAGMPSTLVANTADFDMRMYIPAIKKFQLQIVNNHAVNGIVANLRVRMRYGLRKMTDIDRLKWGIGFSTSEQEAANARITKFGTLDKVYIGTD